MIKKNKNKKRFVHFFYDEITEESVEKLIEKLSDKDKIDLFFSTNGGISCVMKSLIHFLNINHKKIDIYLTNEICSAGTYILMEFKGNIILTKELYYILFHGTDRYTYGFRKSSVDDEIIRQLIYQKNETNAIRLKEIGLNDDEINDFMSGKDVIFYRKDFQRLIDNNNKIKNLT